MERMRTFVALNFAVGVIDKVRTVQKELRQAAGDKGVRVGWVPPPNMHVTLKFLGEIPAENAYAIRDRLADALIDRCAWPVEIAGVGVFPDAERPRVIWIGLRDEGQTSALADEVNGWLSETGFAPETRPFHPHLTLGRIKQGSAGFWEPWQEHSLGRFAPAEVVLYRSDLRSAGAEYVALGRAKLGGSSSKSDY